MGLLLLAKRGYQSTAPFVIAPILGAEMYADPGLEGTYTAGLNGTWVAGGTPTVTESADAHGGAKAQSFAAAATSDRIRADKTVTQNAWYRMECYTKRTAGAGTGVKRYLDTPTADTIFPAESMVGRNLITSAVWDHYYRTGLTWNMTQLTIYIWDATATPTDTVLVDDVSMKPLTTASVFHALLRRTSPNMNAKTRWTQSIEGIAAGTVARLDSAANPQNYLIAVHDGYYTLHLAKVVAGQYTSLVVSTAVPYCENASIEIRCNGNTVQLFYNGKQIGADQTVSDAGIIGNTLAAAFSTGAENTCTFASVMPYNTRQQPETWKPRNALYLNLAVNMMKSGDTLELFAGATYTNTTGLVFTGLPSGTAGQHTRVNGNGATVSGAPVDITSKAFIDYDDLDVRAFTSYGSTITTSTDINFNRCTWGSDYVGAVQDSILIVGGARVWFYDCECVGITASSVASADGFEFRNGCADSGCVRCIAHGFQNGAAVFNNGHGFETYAGTTNIKFTDCEAYNCRVGFSAEGGETGAAAPVCLRCNCHNNDIAAYGAQANSVLYVDEHIGDVTKSEETGGVVTIRS